ncbi:MAG: GatB/YqeY domain-containing protein [Lachnospiraceae bacterium]|jgi:uncharacterized protein YqeY|nr:GatB/YqeY domain-containing protein [Lachnospiraceae bacterium]
MTLGQLQKDMIAALKARDKDRKEAISSLVSAVKKVGIDAGCRDDIPEDMVNTAILKEQRLVKEELDTCPASREDLREQYQKRYDVISEYCPKMMSAEEIEAYIRTNCAEQLASGNKGLVMKTVMPALKGKADGKLINETVAKICG